MIKLDNRLQAIISCVDKDEYVADIGCDHGKVIVWLVNKGIARAGIAVDISASCLQKAQTLAQNYCVEGKIKFVCADGIGEVVAADSIIIAGIGAGEIIKMLSDTPTYAKLVLCPHKDAYELRKFLIYNNYNISKDFIVKSKGKFYPIIVAKKGIKPYNRKWFYFGANLPRSQYFLEYLGTRKEYISRLLQSVPRLEDELMQEWEELKRLTQLTVRDIANTIENVAPLSLQTEKDNSGLAVGNFNSPVKKVLVALDATYSVIAQAIRLGCDMIVAHHPIIFEGVKKFDTKDYYCSCIAEAIKNDITIYCSHTNFDQAPGCLNDKAAQLCGLVDVEQIDMGDGYLARIGELAEQTQLAVFAKEVATAFNDNNLQFVGAIDKLVKKVCVINGGGGGSISYLDEARAAGADVLVTGDVKHHVALYAKETDFALISLGHYQSELPFVMLIKELLQENHPSLEVLIAESTSPYHPDRRM